jgi:P-type Cu2+ transporter
VTDALARLTPSFADRFCSDGRIERVSVHELALGDTILIREGGIIPADGTLLSATCCVDESLLSGESSPQWRKARDTLIAGSTLIEGPAQLRVQKLGNDTALASIATLVGRAHAQRPRLAQLGERAASQFVLRVLLLTVLTIAFWSYVDPSRAFAAALAVLVVSCPCAFALAVPAAITRAISVLAQQGVLVVRPDAIESLASATHVVFDKTGTLTEPHLLLCDVLTTDRFSRLHALQLAAAIARESRHPTARAIVAARRDVTSNQCVTVANVCAVSGFGLRADVEGREVRLGRADFALGTAGALTNDDAVVLADDVGTIATFQLSEQLRSGAKVAIAELQRQGLHIAIASGDAATKVAAQAAHLGIAEWRARLLPADKLAWIDSLRASGARIMVVGDGVNDAPILAGADVGVAQAGSAELAQASSDVVLVDGRLEALPLARTLAQQTLSILRQNHRWTMIYNFTAVPLAAAGLVHPWVAALGMSMSSVCVLLNALRIGRNTARVQTPATRPVTAGTLQEASS